MACPFLVKNYDKYLCICHVFARESFFDMIQYFTHFTHPIKVFDYFQTKRNDKIFFYYSEDGVGFYTPQMVAEKISISAILCSRRKKYFPQRIFRDIIRMVRATTNTIPLVE